MRNWMWGTSVLLGGCLEGGADEDSCATELSGGLETALECDGVALLYGDDDDTWAFTLNSEGEEGSDLALVVLAAGDGMPAAGTFDCSGTLGGGAGAWVAGSETCSITFDRVVEISEAGGLGAWEADGTIEATYIDELLGQPDVVAEIIFSAR